MPGSTAFLEVMRVAPALGRGFAPNEEHWGGASAVLISYGYWQRRFHGDPAALGQQVHVSGYTSTIIGVMPECFPISECRRGYVDAERAGCAVCAATG